MDPTIVLPRPTEAVGVDVATILTVGVGISNTMVEIRRDETVTAEIIATIIRIVAGFMMIIVATAGMTAGFVTVVAM